MGPWVGCVFPPGRSALGGGGEPCVPFALCPLPSLVTVLGLAPDSAPVFSWLLGRAGVNFADSFLLLPTDACACPATPGTPLPFPGKERLSPSPPTRGSALPRWEPLASVPQARPAPPCLGTELTFSLALSLSCAWPSDALEIPSALVEPFGRSPRGPPMRLCLPPPPPPSRTPFVLLRSRPLSWGGRGCAFWGRFSFHSPNGGVSLFPARCDPCGGTVYQPIEIRNQCFAIGKPN